MANSLLSRESMLTVFVAAEGVALVLAQLQCGCTVYIDVERKRLQ